RILFDISHMTLNKKGTTQVATPKLGINGEPASGLPIKILSLILVTLVEMISELAILGILVGGGLSGRLTSSASLG
ncbi:MAG: hypothetical protein KDD45_06865, partial [Bdellovibrionales bacterium]|nr:hypothetical protein [Bdellovibrionales bacterium]